MRKYSVGTLEERVDENSISEIGLGLILFYASNISMHQCFKRRFSGTPQREAL